MKLLSFQLRNYKSFTDSGELRFSDGFNVIVGQNNAGKSALLQGISLRFGNNPHISLKTKPTSMHVVSPLSEVLFSVECDGQELRSVLLSRGAEFLLPAPSDKLINEQTMHTVLDQLFSSQQISISLRRLGNGNIEVTKVPSFAQYNQMDQSMVVRPTEDRTNFVLLGGRGLDRTNELGAHVGQAFTQQLYFFQAERLQVAEALFGTNRALNPDARNLPEVLNILQSTNPERFNRFNSLVSQVLPTIRRIALRPNPSSGQLQIVIWTIDPVTERDDLAISLADSGTGVGQVLAILYVAITSEYARTIVINEPNSFLNPGAAKKLMEILRGFKQLQFIISTHSPEIIRAAQSHTLSVIHWQEGVSSVEQMEADKMDSLQLVLREVGASLSDVFGADQVLWVEGPTEEACFRILFERYLKRPLIGIAIAAVRDIGRLASRKPSASLVWEIYTKLSGAGALMPPALAFSFDREGRTEREVEDIRRRSGNKVHFLPRRMYENYLLDADAIAAVLTLEMAPEGGVTAETVRTWLEKHRDEFLPTALRNATTDELTWLREVSGSGLLDRMLPEISGNKVFFDKVRHGILLTEWLIENKPELLDDLRRYLGGLLDVQS